MVKSFKPGVSNLLQITDLTMKTHFQYICKKEENIKTENCYKVVIKQVPLVFSIWFIK